MRPRQPWLALENFSEGRDGGDCVIPRNTQLRLEEIASSKCGSRVVACLRLLSAFSGVIVEEMSQRQLVMDLGRTLIKGEHAFEFRRWLWLIRGERALSGL